MTLVQLLQHPLIVGASVSADWIAPSPGKYLVEQRAPTADVRTIARGRTTGAQVLKSVRPEDLRDRSVVIGVDLFFWDSTQSQCATSLEALRSLIHQTASLKIPLVLGDVPELLPGRHPCRDSLNREIRSAQHRHVGVLGLEAIHREILTTGRLRYRGRSYAFGELVPDGLHVNTLATAYLADRLEGVLTGLLENDHKK